MANRYFCLQLTMILISAGVVIVVGGIIIARMQKLEDGRGKSGGKDPKLNIGKPSLYSSLAFAEFNYIVEDRVTNTTAMDDTSNSGVVDKRGKTEVTVNNISYSELFSQPVQVLK